MRVVQLLSGGIDSTTLLYLLKNEGHELRGLSLDYGQRHVKELFAAKKIAFLAGVVHTAVYLPGLRIVMDGSSQTSTEIKVPEGHYADPSMKITVVPNRNMVMLSVAAAYAISLNYDVVAYAAHAGDHAIYPDCRPEFVSAMSETLRLAHFYPITLHAPFINKTKAEIVGLGAQLSVPFGLTYSCYKGGEKHCGRCGTCIERREAFKLANVVDPTQYE